MVKTVLAGVNIGERGLFNHRKSSISPPSQISPLPRITPPPPLFSGRKLINPPSLLSPLLLSHIYSSLINDRLYQSTTTDPGWFIYQLEDRISFWSSAAWPKTSCTWAFPLCNLVLYGELIPLSLLRASLCKILISSFDHKMDFAHNFSVDFF